MCKTAIGPSASRMMSIVSPAAHRAAHPPRQSRRVAAHAPLSVITLRMRRVVRERRQRFAGAPEAEEVHIRVDDAFRLGTNRLIFCGAVADGFHFAVGTQNAAVRCDLIDLRLPVAHVRYGARSIQAPADRFRRSLHRRAGEDPREELSPPPLWDQ